MLILLGPLIWLIHFVIVGTIGWLIARDDGLRHAKFIGVVCGVIPFVILILIGIWLEEWLVETFGGRTA